MNKLILIIDSEVQHFSAAKEDWGIVSIRVGRSGLFARGPSFLPKDGWALYKKGYVHYTSRDGKLKRWTRMHRAVIEHISNSPLDPKISVHHQDFDKLNNCPSNLIKMPNDFNPSPSIKHPFTGRYMSKEAYLREFPKEEPDWITGSF